MLCCVVLGLLRVCLFGLAFNRVAFAGSVILYILVLWFWVLGVVLMFCSFVCYFGLVWIGFVVVGMTAADCICNLFVVVGCGGLVVILFEYSGGCGLLWFVAGLYLLFCGIM